MIFSRKVRVALTLVFLALGSLAARAQDKAQTWLLVNRTTEESFFVTDPAEQVRLTKAGWKINGTGMLLTKAKPGTSAMQRYVKGTPQGADRIFAISTEQALAAAKAGYTSEGVLGQASATPLTPDLVPVFQFTKDQRNLWLMDKADHAWAEKSGWKLKGVAFWLWPKPAA